LISVIVWVTNGWIGRIIVTVCVGIVIQITSVVIIVRIGKIISVVIAGVVIIAVAVIVWRGVTAVIRVICGVRVGIVSLAAATGHYL
jgi:hypothetical protein